MVEITDLNTAFGRRACITDLLKTFRPKILPGASGDGKIWVGGV